MGVELNWWAVLLATASSMVVGSVWYAKSVFGSTWAKLAKLDEKKLSEGSPKALGIAVVMSFLLALVLAHMAAISKEYFGVTSLEAGLLTAFWLWLGVSMTTVVVHDSFEHRPIKLTLLTVGNQLVTMLAMGLIIGGLGGF